MPEARIKLVSTDKSSHPRLWRTPPPQVRRLVFLERQAHDHIRTPSPFDLTSRLERRLARKMEQYEKLIPFTIDGNDPCIIKHKPDRLYFEKNIIELEEREHFTQERIRRSEIFWADRYHKSIKGILLKVFSVSARDYEMSRRGYSQLFNSHPLSVETTQIPALLHELPRLPCHRLEGELREFCELTLPELLSFIGFHCTFIPAGSSSIRDAGLVLHVP
ncbi:hypothetical protein EJ02DRAFT_512494 [Clathrospora elynae]|uniref:Uncharacterized protein n=1 Tax=Clathrospora elynae TaxID=706981 RepID=A0A6A5SRS4_9PLEO|nr:hypothetical protein EJ02DRAFT_512494 [Clathrospora elynae]